MNDEFPPVGRLAAIDYGTVRIGVAICDPQRTLASPLDNYTRRNERLDGEYFQRLAREERLVGLVIGLPLHLNGNDSGKSVEARTFGTWLKSLLNLPIAYHDERFSSAFASEALDLAGFTKKRRKERLDKLAAQFILTSFLEAGSRGSTSGGIG